MDIPNLVLQKALDGAKDVLGDHGRRLDAVESVTSGEATDPLPQDMSSRDDQPTWGSIFPWNKVVNGFTISGATVTIVEPELQIGDTTPYTLADTDVTITSDYQYVGLSFTWATSTLAITSPNTTKPVPSGTVYKKWLYLFRFDGSRASLHRAANLGVVTIPAMYGDG
jgi:hypothetical protein